MNIIPIPNDAYRAAQMRAAVEMQLPIVAGVIVLDCEQQIKEHNRRTHEILGAENILIRHDGEIAQVHLDARKARSQ